MSNLLAFFIALVVALGVSPAPVAADNDEFQSVVLQKNQTINKDYLAAGDTVTVSGTVNGDAYVAGGNVIIEGVINGDLLAAGGNIIVRGKVRDNVRVLGGQITITGDVGRNITTLGGTVTIADSAKISGSLAAATGNLSIFAPIGKEANIGAGQLTLGNTVNGDLQAGVGELTLTPNAKVLGNLTYWSDTKAQIDSGAQITGKTTQNLPPKPSDETEDYEKNAKKYGAAAFPVFNLISFLAALITGLLLASFMPVYAQNTANTLLQKPLQSLAVGFLSLVLAPFIFFLLLITIIGIPLDLILLAGFLIFIYLAKIFVGIALGIKTLELLKKKTSLRWTFVLGIFIYYILTMIPLLGFVFWMIAGLMGLGAILIERKQTYASLRVKKLI